MVTARQFKFINSKTGNAIHHYTFNGGTDEALKKELEKIKEQVATKNGVFSGTIYWEEVTQKDKRI